MGIERYEISHEQWERIAPMLPGKASDPERTARDNRLFANGMRSLGLHWERLDVHY